MPNANYAVTGTCQKNGGYPTNLMVGLEEAPTTGWVHIGVVVTNAGNQRADPLLVMVTIVG
jgi:hypothetical protein